LRSSGSFFKSLALLATLLALLVFFAGRWYPNQVQASLFLGMILFLVIMTSAVHLILLKVSKDKPQKFVRVFMLSTMLKLLVYLIFILGGAYMYREYAAGLLVGFLVFYLCFTALEVFFLRRHLDSQ
jgi:L-asparagine transporter-like permease